MTNPSTEHTPSTVAVAACAAAGAPVRDQYIEKKIIGARNLTEGDVDLMNAIKAKGLELEQLCAVVYLRGAQQHSAALGAQDEAELKRIAKAEPARWLELGRVDLQRGLMALTRAVAQPSGF